MISRKAPKQAPPTAIDDKNISIESTASEEFASDEEFIVESILAEQKDKYLIFWAGYPVEKATWEPRKNIRHAEVVEAWKIRKKQEEKGEKTPFDVEAFKAKLEQIAQAKKYRHRLRKIKRKRQGIPVSPNTSDSESTEAKEMEDTSSPEYVRGSKKKSSKVAQTKATKPAPKLPTTRRGRVETSSDDDDDNDSSGSTGHPYLGDEKKAQKKAIQAIKDNRSGRTSTASEDRTPTPTLGQNQSPAPKPREALESSPHLPISQQCPRSRLGSTPSVSSRPVSPTKPQASKLSISTSGLPTAKVSSAGKSMSPTKPQASRPSVGTGGLLAEKPPTGRGQVAKRGSSTGYQNINVFAGGKTRKTKATLIDQAANPSKKEKHFSNMHIQYKAQIQSRNKADAAPDPTAVGGLFDPSKPNRLPSMRPSTLQRNSSANVVPPSSNIGQDPSFMDVDSGSPVNDKAYTEPAWPERNQPEIQRPDWTEKHGNNSICWFWYNTTCNNKYACKYYHADDPSLPIAPYPGASAPKPYTKDTAEAVVTGSSGNSVPEQQRPPWTEKAPNSAICWFWRKQGHCNKGVTCNFLHMDQPNLPLAPDPAAYWPIRPTCRYFQAGHCHKGDDCSFAHPREPSLHSVDPAQKYDLEPDITAPASTFPNGPTNPNNLQTSNLFVTDEADPIYQEPEPIARPAPRRAVSFAVNEPMPAPHEPQTYPPPGPQRSISMGTSIPNMSETRRPVPSGPRKSVSFAENERTSRTDEPRGFIRTGPSHSKGPKVSNKVCIFWLRGDCHHGETCWNRHYVGDRPPDETVDEGESGLSDYQTSSSRQARSNVFATDPISETEVPETQDRRTSSIVTNIPILGTAMRPETDISDPTSVTPVSITSAAPKVTRKVSLNDYRRQKEFKTRGATAKEVIFGSEESKSIVLHFGDIEHALQQPWAQSFNALPKLQFDQMCSAQDFKAQNESILSQRFSQGNILSDPGDQAASTTLNGVSQQLRLISSGLISTSADFLILIYPPGDEWKFIEESTESVPSDSLRYLIFQTTLDISKDLPPLVAEKPTNCLRTLVKSIHELSFGKLVPKQSEDKIYHIYLLFPQSANDTASFLIEWIQAAFSRRRCKIYSSQTEGSWNFFAHSPTVEFGTVLIHESAITAISDLPALQKVISGVHNRQYNFWYISDSTFPYPLFSPPRDSTLGQITATRILPHGQAILLTPSFLVAEPERTYQFIKWFHQMIPTKTRGTYKLVCCFNFSDYLLDLALAKSVERDDHLEKHRDMPAKEHLAEQAGLGYRVLSERFACHRHMTELLSKDIAEDSSSFYDSDLDFGDEAASPVVYADESIDPDDEKALVNWFVGWSITHLDQFRKFTVLGTGKASKERAVRIKEITIDNPSSLAENLPDHTRRSINTESFQANNMVSLEPPKPPGFQSFDGANDPQDPVSSLDKSTHREFRINVIDTAARPSSPCDAAMLPHSLRMSEVLQVSKDNAATPPQFDGLGDEPPHTDPRTTGINEYTRRPFETDRTGRQQLVPGNGRDLPYKETHDLGAFGPYAGMENWGRDHQNSASPFRSRTHSRRGSAASPTMHSPAAELTPRNYSRRGSGISFTIPSPAKVGSRNHSRRGSGSGVAMQSPSTIPGAQSPSANPTMQSPPAESPNMMDVELQNAILHEIEDKVEDEDKNQGQGKEEGEKAKTIKKEIRFEPTTEWYGKLQAEGGGWEHIYVDSWDKCFKHIGVGK
jgi:hypothetical protein